VESCHTSCEEPPTRLSRTEPEKALLSDCVGADLCNSVGDTDQGAEDLHSTLPSAPCSGAFDCFSMPLFGLALLLKNPALSADLCEPSRRLDPATGMAWSCACASVTSSIKGRVVPIVGLHVNEIPNACGCRTPYHAKKAHTSRVNPLLHWWCPIMLCCCSVALQQQQLQCMVRTERK
jgi:hypothetical protein